VILSFHNVIPDDMVPLGDPSLHPAVSEFARILDWLTANYTVVTLRELTGRHREGRSLNGLAALTFDDACRGVYEHAAPLLAQAMVPATSFVVARAPENGDLYWWDRLASTSGLDTGTRRRCLEDLAGEGQAVIDRMLCKEDHEDLPDLLRSARWPSMGMPPSPVVPSLGIGRRRRRVNRRFARDR
jgi:peptidoglycan/xylan/chitin deacetylase (PgdA/CDA1 family)